MESHGLMARLEGRETTHQFLDVGHSSVVAFTQ